MTLNLQFSFYFYWKFGKIDKYLEDDIYSRTVIK